MLICISPTYCSIVRDRKLQRSGTSSRANNARAIYRMMQHEFKDNDFTNKRFIPVLICGAQHADSPPWFQKICPKEMFYKYPEKLRNLLYHLLQPSKVMDRFIDKQRLNKPFHSDPKHTSKEVAQQAHPTM